MEHLNPNEREHGADEAPRDAGAPDEAAFLDGGETQTETLEETVAVSFGEFDFTRPDVSWPLVASALRECAAFAGNISDGTGADFTCEVPTATRLRAALELSEVALLWLREEFNDELARSLNWHRGLIDELEPLTFEGEPQGDETPQGNPLEADAREAVAA
jgi:hypothetical protein